MFYVSEYHQRKRLAKLGLTQPLSELDDLTATVFCMIDMELNELERRELEKRGRGRK